MQEILSRNCSSTPHGASEKVLNQVVYLSIRFPRNWIIDTFKRAVFEVPVVTWSCWLRGRWAVRMAVVYRAIGRAKGNGTATLVAVKSWKYSKINPRIFNPLPLWVRLYVEKFPQKYNFWQPHTLITSSQLFQPSSWGIPDLLRTPMWVRTLLGVIHCGTAVAYEVWSPNYALIDTRLHFLSTQFFSKSGWKLLA